MDIADFIARSNATKSPHELFGLLVRAASHAGFDQVAYAALNYREAVNLAGNATPAVALNYPVEWRDRYFEQGYDEVDPILHLVPNIASPFCWDTLATRYCLNAKQRLMFDEAREAGLKNGASVPLHGPLGRVAVLSFASRADDADPSPHLGYLNVLASQFHAAFTGLARDPPDDAALISLSRREKECLTWVAQGKSSWDIGMILGISENTVNFHLKKAMRKLGTTSRMVAVVKAVRLNLIDPPIQ